MPTARNASVAAGLAIDVAPASRGPHVIVRDSFEEEVELSKRVSVEFAGYANCEARTNWIWCGPKPEMQTIS